jgi:lipopolysaccharide/colanic/teichoic acid biosynthesis glycosyltransferase
MADFLFGVIFFVIFSPIMFLNACLIKLTSPGPILYSQKRMGQNGRSFILHKFRTMRQEEGGALWTTENDHRITFVGKILRASHLDELPQLWNIIRGDISFIGPRAERLELAEYYSQLPYYEIRHIIKPGFTGWAQVNYRPSASLEEALEKLKYDIYYIKNRSLLLDLLIIIRTIRLFFSSPK